MKWSLGSGVLLALLAVMVLLFCSVQTVHASPAGASLVSTQMVALSPPVLTVPPAPAYVNPLALSFSAGYATSGYNHNFGSQSPMVELAARYKHFLGPVDLFGTARYSFQDASPYWRSKDQWTAAAEVPVGNGSVLFARYENHFRTDDDWLWGGIRFNLN